VYDDYLASRSRRTLLRATGAGAVGVLSGALLGPTSLAWAAPLSGATPTVEKLSIRVVTDSSYSALLPRRANGRRRDCPFRATAQSEPGAGPRAGKRVGPEPACSLHATGAEPAGAYRFRLHAADVE
jgi:hypothetical protein